MSTLPVDLKDRAYNHSDFMGRGYVTTFPDFLRDASEALLSQWYGACSTPGRLLPSLRKISLTCSRNRQWHAGMVLIFTGRNTGQIFALQIISYDPSTGAVNGAITNVSTESFKRFQSAEVRSDTFWDISPSQLGAVEYSRNNGSVLGIASGGLGAKISSQSNSVKALLGMDYFGNGTLMVEDDFFGLGEKDIPGEGGSSHFEITNFVRPSNADPHANWGALKGNVAATGNVCRIGTPAGKECFQITTSASTDFFLSTRIYLSALSDGSDHSPITFGYSSEDGTQGVTMYYDFDGSANWVYKTEDSGGGSSVISATAVTAGAFVTLTISKSAGTITFYVNNVAIGTKAIDFPEVLVGPFLKFNKSFGSGARYLLVDYIRLAHKNGS